ncbi:MAG: DUF885 family protein [Pseudomonadales bacterium]|nr:DUF885 family protein [Pseudomonadales bacterium]
MHKLQALITLAILLIALGIPSHGVAQSTISVNADLSIDISTLQDEAETYSAALIFAEPNWQLVNKNLLLTSEVDASALVQGAQLTLHCLLYQSDTYRVTFTELADTTEELVFEFSGAELNADCANDSTLDNALLPDSIPAYQIESTSALLDSVSVQLSSLSFSEFLEESYSIIRARDPENAIADGDFDDIEIATAELFSISDDYYYQTVDVQNLILETLTNYDRELLNEEDQLSYDIYLAFLETELEWAEYRNFEYPGTYGFFGWPGSTESFFTNVFTFNNVSEAQLYLVLLNQIGRRFEQIYDLLIARRNVGIVEPSSTLGWSQSIVAAMANTSAATTSYYQSFDEQLATLIDISENEKEILRQQMLTVVEQQVLPAYSLLSARMLGLLNIAPSAIGFGQFDGGAEFYDFTLRYFTSSNMDAAEVHLLGQSELARINAEMDILFQQLAYPESETLAQKFDRVNQDGGFIAAGNVKALYEQIIDDAYARLPESFRIVPEQEVEVIGGPTGGFYIRGSDDGSRPSAFYANTETDQPYTTMPTLAYHEAIPGHHLQIALANELDLPTFRRKYNNTSYIEGWGLYAERLPKDLGWYEGDIYGDLGRLQFEAMRAARLVVDTGIHVMGWTWTQADEYHIANVGFPGSIARYSVWPGQATAYQTGMLKILELRERAESELGNLYDIRDFHDAVIGNGAMPLQILEQVVESYIANK